MARGGERHCEHFPFKFRFRGQAFTALPFVQRFFKASVDAYKQHHSMSGLGGDPLPVGITVSLAPNEVVLRQHVQGEPLVVADALSEADQRAVQERGLSVHGETETLRGSGGTKLAWRLAWKVQACPGHGLRVMVPVGVLKSRAPKSGSLLIRAEPQAGNDLPPWLSAAAFPAMFTCWYQAHRLRLTASSDALDTETPTRAEDVVLSKFSDSNSSDDEAGDASVLASALGSVSSRGSGSSGTRKGFKRSRSRTSVTRGKPGRPPSDATFRKQESELNTVRMALMEHWVNLDPVKTTERQISAAEATRQYSAAFARLQHWRAMYSADNNEEGRARVFQARQLVINAKEAGVEVPVALLGLQATPYPEKAMEMAYAKDVLDEATAAVTPAKRARL